ncbi:MAG: alpha/beta hydrolase [Thermoflexales bacterium]
MNTQNPVALLFLIVVTLSGCAFPPGKVLVLSPVIVPDQAEFKGVIDIGGRGMYLECHGSGEPTIVFDAGLQAGGWKLTKFGAQLADSTRICFYDRPNVADGKSDPVTGIRTSADIAADLETLLAVAGIRPPWLLIGHGFGGMNMTVFAAAHAEDVAGLILMDPLPPDTLEAWMTQPAGRAGSPPNRYVLPSGGEPARSRESIDLAASSAQLRQIRTLGAIPVTLFAARRPLAGLLTLQNDVAADRLERAWKENRAWYAQLAPAMRVIEVDDSGSLDLNDSELAIRDAARDLISRYRAPGGPLM